MGSFFTTILNWLRNWYAWLIALIRRLFGGGGTIEDDKCCHLARPDNECRYFGDKASFSCPDGYYRQWWHCCEGTQLIGCGECTTNTSTCWSGSFECSIWWWTTQPC